MKFTKSFGYALRGILYVAIAHKEKRKVQLDEIAEELVLPRHFLGKVMQLVAREGILNSEKGHNGGFSINDKTMNTTLLELTTIVDGNKEQGICALRLKQCNGTNPCPVHHEIAAFRKQWDATLSKQTIKDLLRKGGSTIISSIATK